MENSNRRHSHKRDPRLEELLSFLERKIGHIDNELVQGDLPSKPIFFIMGVARSGTTLLSQFLAENTNLCYPNNILSRFYFSPMLGSMISQILIDFDHLGEFQTEKDQKYSSRLGKTSGLNAPHEFWYYWRKFFKISEDQKLLSSDVQGFTHGLKKIQLAHDAPLFMKGMIMNWNIPFLYKNIDNCFFIFIKRDICFNTQSILESRQEFYGDYGEWYSFKNPEFKKLEKLSAVEQVYNQVFLTNKSISEGLNKIPNNNYFEISYESFCQSPQKIIDFVTNICGSDLAKSDTDSVEFENKKFLENFPKNKKSNSQLP